MLLRLHTVLACIAMSLGALAPAFALQVTDYAHATLLDIPASEGVNISFEADRNLVSIRLSDVGAQLQRLQSRASPRFRTRPVEREGRIDLLLKCSCAVYERRTRAGALIWLADLDTPKVKLGFQALPNSARPDYSSFSRSERLGFAPLPNAPEPSLELAEQPMDAIRLPITADPPNTAEKRLLSQLGRSNEILRPSSNPDKRATVPIADEQIEFRALTSTDDRADPGVVDAATRLTASCSAYARFDVATWPNTEQALMLLREARRELVKLDEDPLPARLRDLQSAYFSLGMGAEAAGISKAMDATEETTDLALAISGVLDGAETLENMAVPFQCDSLAIWRLLAGGELTPKDIQLARRQFSNAPDGVKSAIGTRLIKGFLAAGDRDAAYFALNDLEGAPEQRMGERDILASMMARESGADEEANETLEAVVSRDSDAAPNALIALVQENLDAGQPLDAKTKDTLVAYRMERDLSEDAPELLSAEIQNDINTTAFAEATEKLAAFEKIARPSQINLLLDKLGNKILTEQSDASFLVAAMAVPPAYHRRFSEELQANFKERFQNLGLGHLGDDLASMTRQILPSRSGQETLARSDETVQTQTQTPARIAADNTDTPSQIAQTEVEQAEQIAEDAPPLTEPQPVQNIPQQSGLRDAVQSSSALLSDLDALKASLQQFGL